MKFDFSVPRSLTGREHYKNQMKIDFIRFEVNLPKLPLCTHYTVCMLLIFDMSYHHCLLHWHRTWQGEDQDGRVWEDPLRQRGKGGQVGRLWLQISSNELHGQRETGPQLDPGVRNCPRGETCNQSKVFTKILLIFLIMRVTFLFANHTANHTSTKYLAPEIIGE